MHVMQTDRVHVISTFFENALVSRVNRRMLIRHTRSSAAKVLSCSHSQRWRSAGIQFAVRRADRISIVSPSKS